MTAELRVFTWNLGGLNADKVLELTRNFVGDPTLKTARILLLQEVVTEPGLYFDARYDWVLIYGKKEGEWRGEGVLYHRSQGLHHHSKVHRHAISTTIRCQHSGAKTRLLSAHLPHHASLELTAVLLSDWGHGVPKKAKSGWGSTPTRPSLHAYNVGATARTHSQGRRDLTQLPRVGACLPAAATPGDQLPSIQYSHAVQED